MKILSGKINSEAQLLGALKVDSEQQHYDAFDQALPETTIKRLAIIWKAEENFHHAVVQNASRQFRPRSHSRIVACLSDSNHIVYAICV